jgi:hypothetical protein
MLEVLLIIFLSKKIAGILRAKGRSPTWYVVALVAFWIGGEFLGAFTGMALMDGDSSAALYGCALVGAALGVVAAFVLANGASSLNPQQTFTGGFPITPATGAYPAAPPWQPPQ